MYDGHIFQKNNRVSIFEFWSCNFACIVTFYGQFASPSLLEHFHKGMRVTTGLISFPSMSPGFTGGHSFTCGHKNLTNEKCF